MWVPNVPLCNVFFSISGNFFLMFTFCQLSFSLFAHCRSASDRPLTLDNRKIDPPFPFSVCVKMAIFKKLLFLANGIAPKTPSPKFQLNWSNGSDSGSANLNLHANLHAIFWQFCCCRHWIRLEKLYKTWS